MATRRTALTLLASGLGIAACRMAIGQPMANATYIGIETAQDTGVSTARFVAASGQTLGRLPLDFRAHGMAKHDGKLVVFPRRPGNRFAVVDLVSLEILSVVTAPQDRHFFGHGAFSADGKWLLVTENDLTTLGGAIGIYSLHPKLRREGSIPLPRPGPHEIIASHDGAFFVAMGGLESHPEYGRTPLNLPGFTSEVLRLDFDRSDAEPMGVLPGSDGVSLRHLAQTQDGTLYIGGQKKDPRRAEGSHVLWRLTAGKAHAVLEGAMLGGYVSSVAAQGRSVLVSSKKSGQVLQFKNNIILSRAETEGASAVGFDAKGPIWSGYTSLDVHGAVVTSDAKTEFDNHGLGL